MASIWPKYPMRDFSLVEVMRTGTHLIQIARRQNVVQVWKPSILRQIMELYVILLGRDIMFLIRNFSVLMERIFFNGIEFWL